MRKTPLHVEDQVNFLSFFCFDNGTLFSFIDVVICLFNTALWILKTHSFLEF